MLLFILYDWPKLIHSFTSQPLWTPCTQLGYKSDIHDCTFGVRNPKPTLRWQSDQRHLILGRVPPTCQDVRAATCGRRSCFTSTSCWLWRDVGGAGSACSAPPVLGLHGNQCNFRGVTQHRRHRAARQAVPQNILGKGREKKSHLRINNIPERHAKRAALFMPAPPTVFQGSTKSTCCFVPLMICPSLSRASVGLFVCHSSSAQWRLHTRPKMRDGFEF